MSGVKALSALGQAWGTQRDFHSTRKGPQPPKPLPSSPWAHNPCNGGSLSHWLFLNIILLFTLIYSSSQTTPFCIKSKK